MWTDGKGTFYEGDCQLGDREATRDEVLKYSARVAMPEQVPVWAFQAALKGSGKYDAINAAVSLWATDKDTAKVAAYFAWTMGNTVARRSTFIATLVKEFRLVEAELDKAFIAAQSVSLAAG